MDYISYLSDSDLKSLILDTKAELYICMPMLNETIINTVLKLSEQRPECSIKIVVDFNPDTFYKGYGDFNSINKFKNLYKKLPHSISQLEGNRISLIISDEKGYFLFLQSSYIESKAIKYNGIKIEKTGIARIKNTMFHELNTPDELQNAINNAIISESKEKVTDEDIISAPVKKLEEEKIKKTNEILEINPPLKGSMDEVISVYENKLRYIDIEFEGSKFWNNRISIPKEYMPIQSKNLKDKLRNTYELFEEKDRKNLEDNFKLIAKMYDSLMKNYTYKSPSLKFHIIRVNEMTEINKCISTIEDLIDKYNQSNTDFITKSIEKSKNILRSELIKFYNRNKKQIPVYFTRLGYNDPEKIVEFIINEIKWPIAKNILKNIKFKIVFMDIPISDIYDHTFRKKLVDCKVIPNDDISNVTNIQDAMTVN